MWNFENLDKHLFPGVGAYHIPRILPVKEPPQGPFLPINTHYSEKHPEGKNLHFFVEDTCFIRLWNAPGRYIPRLSQYRAVLAPDFSLYTDMPMAMQIYNHYRKHWLAAYWQLHGITVYPTISWSTPESYAWCFDGEPVGGIVAVSSVGTQKSRESRRLFLQGYGEMMERLSPAGVIFYGGVPEGCGGEIFPVAPYYETVRERKRQADACKNPGGVG